ncbi:hypothetical protein J3458_013417 [Metarhizium acridum]|nr:hypothetical protein J3458_013417 [Metarhizium acridum]
MNVRLSKLHDKFMRHEVVQHPDFEKCITEESISGNQWTLRLSYTDQNHARIEDHFDIQVIDHHSLPHVTCSLTRFMHRGGPRNDTREALFKPGKWLGPEIVVNPIQQQSKSPRPSSTRSLEHPPLTTVLTTQNSREDSRVATRSPSTTPQSNLASRRDRPSTPASIGSKINKRENSVEYRILTIGKAFAKGTQILVSKPKGSLRQRLATVRRCFRSTIEKGPSCQSITLRDMWELLQEQDVSVGDVYFKTRSHIEKLENDVGSTSNVATYIAGVREFYGLDKMDSPPPKVRELRGRQRLELAFDRIMSFIKTLTAYYEGDVDIAIGIFTFLEVLRRLAAKNTETGEETIPLLNPVAFQWWYERENCSYEDMCQRFDLLAFSSASPEMCIEKPVTTILNKIRQRSQSLTRLDAEDETNSAIEHTSPTTEADCADKSKNLLLQIAPRLAKYMTPRNKDTYVDRFKGDDEEQENMRLALRILKGEALNDELLSTSLDVVYAIVDILLYSPTMVQRRSQPDEKRRRLEHEMDRDTRIDASEVQSSLQELPLPPALLENNAEDQHVPPEMDQIISENQGRIGLGEWTGCNFTGGMDYDFLLNQAFGSAGTSNHFGSIVDPSQFDSQFVQSTYPEGADFGGMDASDGLQLFSWQVFPNNDWSGSADVASGGFFHDNHLG